MLILLKSGKIGPVFLGVFIFMFPSITYGHGDISKFPPAVQILQYKMALFMNPDDLETRNKLGLAFWLDGQLDESEGQFRQVLGKDKNNFNALDGLGLVLLKKDMPEPALKYFKKAEKINSSDLLVHVHKALAYRKMDKKDLAEKELSVARSLARDDQDQQKIKKEIKLLSSS